MTLNKIIRALALCAVLFVAGCLTTRQPASEYLLAPSTVRLQRPIFITVIDRRAPEQRQASETRFWRYTVDAADGRRTALDLANDLSRILRGKGIAKTVLVVPSEHPLPRDELTLEVVLECWYGRIPHRPSSSAYSEKLLRLVSPSYVDYAEGRCRICTSLGVAGRPPFSLGENDGKAVVEIGPEASTANEGRIVSSLAADQAMASMLRRLENALKTLPTGTLDP